jgi:hypothetical protein
LVARRLELLKLEGLGFSRAEIVKELSVKLGCSGRTVYSDFETQESWQPTFQSVSDVRKLFYKVINRFEQIYRQATMQLLTFTEEVTNDKEVMKKLLSVGFEYVCQKDKMLFFRKRK